MPVYLYIWGCDHVLMWFIHGLILVYLRAGIVTHVGWTRLTVSGT